eukprot:CAMPEP_0205811928 /NCGR_PEP_ID=MMETSP0205-20121125/16220_1 /ASSEMBLY_ACC=CAM_ASM_000278 /TAXON_ID=36767 /ORGANISM="Euplotes focardii, Strain TN1" /LENGTH=97 /DNA_ID=CAMNT_0053091773 /DNA_START=728 /DNA_END=1021 /DNA_ORIENTATION=+
MTSIAQLTMEEFEAIQDGDLVGNDKFGMDPPAFVKNLLKKNKALKSIQDSECIDAIEDDPSETTNKKKIKSKEEEEKEQIELEYMESNKLAKINESN